MTNEIEDIEIGLLLEALYQRYHYDFRQYARASIKRRLIQARSHFGLPSLTALQERALHDPEMLPRLLTFLTVQVSEMFRDPGYFRALREQVLPHLRTYPSLKVWIAGCSAGEELYSMAILFREEGLFDRTLFYATDINPDALRAAEAGIYPLDRIRNSPKITRSPAAVRPCPTTIGRIMAGRSSTSLCAPMSSSRTTAWSRTPSSPRCSSSPAATS